MNPYACDHIYTNFNSINYVGAHAITSTYTQTVQRIISCNIIHSITHATYVYV